MEQFDFARHKYNKELLIDCFLKSDQLDITKPSSRFLVTFYEVIFVIKGSGALMLENEKIIFQEGSVLFLPPNKWRQWTEVKEDFDAYYLLFEEEFISIFFNDPLYLYRFNYFYNTSTPSILHLDKEKQCENLTILENIRFEISNFKEDSKHMLRALLYTLLIRLNRNYETEHNVERSFYEKISVLKFRKLLEENIRSKHRVAEYADLLGLSTSHLNKLLKLHFGKNCSELIKNRLTLEIKKELLFSQKTVSEISHELGFSEASNFIRFFQSQVGQSPKSYRIQNDNS